MKFGMNLFLWTDQLKEELLPTLGSLREMGYDGVEIPIFSPTVAECAQWGKKLDGLGFERTACTARSGDENCISPDPKVRQKGIEANKHAIDCCQAMDIKLLCGPFHSGLGVFSGSGPTAEEWKWGVENMQKVAEHAEKAGVTLCLEPLNRFECYFLNCVKDTNHFIEDVKRSNCKMLYDTFHSHIEEKDQGEAIRAGKQNICHVHISSNDRGTPGDGQIRWDSVFPALKEIKYDGWMVVEAFGMSLPALAAATKIWRRMYQDELTLAKQGLQFMKAQWNTA